MGEKNSLGEGFPLSALNPILLFPKTFVFVGSGGAFFLIAQTGQRGRYSEEIPYPFSLRCR